MKEEVGKKFLVGSASDAADSQEDIREVVRVLVVDSVLGSRFELVQGASQPGFIIDASPTIEAAQKRLERFRYAVVIVDQDLADGSGLDFLVRLRATQPLVSRALVATDDGLSFKRAAIEGADLAFVLTKPWGPEALRRTLRELVGSDLDFAGWVRPGRVRPSNAEGRGTVRNPREHEVLLRGLLAGLNSCESESELFEMIHRELAERFGISRWLWIDDEHRTACALEGDWPIELSLPIEDLDKDVQELHERARRSFRVTRLDEWSRSDHGEQGLVTLGWTIRISGRSATTGLLWAERRQVSGLAAVLRELQAGMQMALQRICDASLRANAARDLARRVSQELRTPMGALAHAIDRMRGEAERAGLSTEWVDKISSESKRVAKAVEHLEGEILSDPSGSQATPL